jgi:hypothetical protein
MIAERPVPEKRREVSLDVFPETRTQPVLLVLGVLVDALRLVHVLKFS